MFNSSGCQIDFEDLQLRRSDFRYCNDPWILKQTVRQVRSIPRHKLFELIA